VLFENKQGDAMSKPVVGLQLYTVRDQTAQDFKHTIHRVARIGYKAVEFAGYGNLTSKEMTALLKEAGLQAAGTHVGLAALEQDLDRELNYCVDIGCSLLIIPHLGPEWRNADRFRALAVRMNEMGRRGQERGITLVYHNHDFEFAQSDGQYLLDILLEATDPALVKLELDTYWAAYAGVDPIAYMHRHAGRIALVHLKDMTPERTFTEVGDGTLDIAGYCKAAQESGAQFYIVENDKPAIPSLDSARRSLENLSRIV
jgi:sugar phosphate isomerase/epimerase